MHRHATHTSRAKDRTGRDGIPGFGHGFLEPGPALRVALPLHLVAAQRDVALLAALLARLHTDTHSKAHLHTLRRHVLPP